MIRYPDSDERVLPAKHQRQPHESYDDFSRRTKKRQWLRAGLGCGGIHIGLTILVFLVTIVFVRKDETLAMVVGAYLLLGWLPLIKLYPILLRKLD